MILAMKSTWNACEVLGRTTSSTANIKFFHPSFQACRALPIFFQDLGKPTMIHCSGLIFDAIKKFFFNSFIFLRLFFSKIFFQPLKIMFCLQSEDFAMEKEKQLADIKFTPLHRRPSPGGHLEPLQHKLSTTLPTHTLFADEAGTQRRGRKKTKKGTAGGATGARVSFDGGVLSSSGLSQSIPRSGGRLEPLEASVQVGF